MAVVGGGPAGLTAAADLRAKGYAVTIFESQPKLGGMLRYGIPKYRLPDDVLDREIQYILDEGVQVKTGTRVENVKKLLRAKSGDGNGAGKGGQFDAVFVAIGASVSRKLGVPGEDAQGVWPGLKFLHDVNNGKRPALGANVVVIGGGDVAMDAARCARRMPGVKSVHLACLEQRDEMPAHAWEAAEALEEGVEFNSGWGPTKIEADGGKVTGVAFRACTRVFDENKRFSPQFDDKQTMSMAADTVIVTIGQGIDAAALADVTTAGGGRMVADKETLATSVPGLFAGGDAVLGPASMVDAMAQGHRAAEAIDAFLRGTTVKPAPRRRDPRTSRRTRRPTPRAPSGRRCRRPGRRSAWPTSARSTAALRPEEAVAEAKRCLACGLCSECGQCVKACTAGAIIHDMQSRRPRRSERRLGHPRAGLRGVPGLRPRRVRPRPVRQRPLEHAVRAAPLGRRPDERRGPPALRRQGTPSASRSSSAWARATRPAATATARPSAACRPPRRRWWPWSTRRASKISIFCMDIRAFGKEFDGYVNRARDENGVEYIRAMPSRIVEMPGSKNLRIRYFDENGEEQQREFDLVVLSVGLRPSASVKDMAERLGLDLNAVRLLPRRTASRRWPPRKPGIYVAGRVPGTQGHPRVGGPGVGRRLVRHGATGRRARHADPAPRVSVGTRRLRRGAAHRRLHLPLRPQHRLGRRRRGRGRGRLAHAQRRPRRGQPLHLLRHQPAAHQGHDPRAPAQPPRRGLLLAAHARNPLPGNAARVGPQPVPLRHDQHPRPVLVGPPRGPRGRHREGRGPDAHGRGAGPAPEGPADRPTARDAVGPGGRRRPGRHDRGPGGGRPGLPGAPGREGGRARRQPAAHPLHAGTRRRAGLPEATGRARQVAPEDHDVPLCEDPRDRRPRRQLQDHPRCGRRGKARQPRRHHHRHRRRRARADRVPLRQESARDHAARARGAAGHRAACRRTWARSRRSS